jgi:peptidoglycan hydrolase-like protein with peptidoglycan-binding domain
MSSYELTASPASAGSAVLSGLAGLGVWALGKIWRAPLTSLGMTALTVGIAYSAANALYLQEGAHPAPYFSSEPALVAPVIAPQPHPQPARNTAESTPQSLESTIPASGEVTGSVNSTLPAEVQRAEIVGNEDVAAMQQHLAEMGLYSDTVDGYYGPATATAIRAFENREGLNPVGALTSDIVERILATPADARPLPVEVAPVNSADISPASDEPVGLPVLPDAAAPATAETASGTGNVTLFDPIEALTQRVASNAAGTTAQPAMTLATNEELVSQVQRGLASLGFLHGTIDGVAGESTARAIRNFEVYYNYEVTGEVTPELVDLLANAGAAI